MLISKSDLKSLKKQYNFLMHNKFYISVRYVHGIPNQKLSTCVVGLFEAGLFLDFFLGKKYIYNIKDISNVFYSTYYIVIEFADNSFWTLVGNEKQVTKIYSILTTEYNISSISKNITDYLPNIIPSNSVSETLEHNEISALTNTENEIETPDKAVYELPVQINDIHETDNNATAQEKHIENKDEHINFPDWYISVSFGKSSSSNYMKAVMLAQQAPQYHTQTDNGVILHQAIYSSKPNEYLSFISLYELVANWKSSFVIINGKIIDRKIVGQLNYCYGDKCRSGNPNFCYGASYMTENPFGCHRLQVSAANNPWWSFYRLIGNTYILNQEELKKRIDSYASIYCICPCFNYQQIMKAYNSLPVKLSQKKYAKLWADGFGLKM